MKLAWWQYSVAMSDTPVAYFITFRAYGTWLPGDRRGAIRHASATSASAPIPSNRGLEFQSRGLLHGDPVGFDKPCREALTVAIGEVCEVRGWNLLPLNVRTNHVHLVVQCDASPERAMSQFKSYATRRMVLEGLFPASARPWAWHGSTRYLWSDQDVEDTWAYVIHGQGPDL